MEQSSFFEIPSIRGLFGILPDYRTFGVQFEEQIRKNLPAETRAVPLKFFFTAEERTYTDIHVALGAVMCFSRLRENTPFRYDDFTVELSRSGDSFERAMLNIQNNWRAHVNEQVRRVVDMGYYYRND